MKSILRFLLVSAAFLVGWSASVAAAQAVSEERPASPAPTLVSADLREHQSLDGAWHWSIDPFRDGIAGFHGGPPGPSTNRWADTVQAEVAARDPAAWFEFDMQRSAVTHLPGSWIGHSPQTRHYQGLVWYQRTFSPSPLRAGTRTFLRVGAADHCATVFVNGQRAGSHCGGFTPFALDVTKLLRPGENQVTIGVDSARTSRDVPPPVTDWETYGGITRSVTLVTVPDTYVDDAWVRLTRDGRIAATVRLDGPARAGMAVRVRIPVPGLSMEGRTDAAGDWTGHAPASRPLKRWSPDSPTLFDENI